MLSKQVLKDVKEKILNSGKDGNPTLTIEEKVDMVLLLMMASTADSITMVDNLDEIINK